MMTPQERFKANAWGQFYINLQLAFIVLKLCGVIDWYWIWVMTPMWASVLLNTSLRCIEEDE